MVSWVPQNGFVAGRPRINVVPAGASDAVLPGHEIRHRQRRKGVIPPREGAADLVKNPCLAPLVALR
jgi:hypothetical protein